MSLHQNTLASEICELHIVPKKKKVSEKYINKWQSRKYHHILIMKLFAVYEIKQQVTSHKRTVIKIEIPSETVTH